MQSRLGIACVQHYLGALAQVAVVAAISTATTVPAITAFLGIRSADAWRKGCSW